MNIFFRVDASAKIGVGHIIRCLALAESLRARGIQCKFICRQLAGHLLSLISDAGMPVTALPATEIGDGTSREDYASWLGVTQSEDAAQSIEALDGEMPDWIVADHYSLDADWERQLRPHVKQIMVIDDLANRAHDCDLLLDQNFSLDGDCRYTDLVPQHCRTLLGPRYALLHPEYAKHRKAPRARDGYLRQVFVFFGGSDPYNMTGLALGALSSSDLSHLKVDVVVGANNVHSNALLEQAALRPGTVIYGPRPHLAKLMARADLAIGAGGATTWERMCLGLPTLVISIADNQRPACEALSRVGLINFLGDAHSIQVTDIRNAIQDAVSNASSLHNLSIPGEVIVDGAGTLRVAECIDATPQEYLQMRPACAADVGLYFDWVNDTDTRKQALKSAPVPWTQHEEWFKAKLEDRSSHLFVLEARMLPVGQIRFDLEDSEARIDYSIDPLFRGRGWAKRLVALGMNRIHLRKHTIFRAEVKRTNVPSAAVFKRLGFRESTTSERNDLKVFLFDPTTAILLSEIQ